MALYKLSEAMKLSMSKLMKMSESDIKRIVSESGQTLNRRYINIKVNRKADQRAVHEMDRSGGRFSVANKNKVELLREFKREQSFYNKKNSTVRGAINSQRNLERSLLGGKTAVEFSKLTGHSPEAVEEIESNIKKSIANAWDSWRRANDIRSDYYGEYAKIQELQDAFKSSDDPMTIISQLNDIANDLDAHAARDLGLTLEEYRSSWEEAFQ